MTLPVFPLAASLVWPAAAVDTDKDDVKDWAGTVEKALNALFSNDVLINGRIDVSVNSNVLTVALKTSAGADPSDDDPVYVIFRNSTLASGAPEIVRVSAATSLTIAAAATMGTSNNIPFRLWIVAINDSGTVRLGAVNLSAGAIQYPLTESELISTTNPAGNNAGVVYSSASVVSKPFCFIGFLTWETALATAGNWSASPDIVHILSYGSRKPGDIVQRQRTLTTATAAGTTTTPHDDTIPQQSTEGVNFLSQAITPKSKANILKIRAGIMVSSTVVAHMTMALHQDAVEAALAATSQHIGATNAVASIVLFHQMLAAVTAATTFKINAGGSTAGTFRLNGVSGNRLYGGVANSFIEIEEVMG